MTLVLGDYRQVIALDEAPSPRLTLEPEMVGRSIDELVKFFEQEQGLSAGSRALARLRNLLTVRPPGPLPARAQTMLDRLLRTLLLERGVVECEDLLSLAETFSATRYPAAASCVLWRGDITQLRADAIVNAANSQLLGCFHPQHQCIDNAIHWHAGPQLRQDCARIMALQAEQEPTGQAKLTRAYNLPASFVLHTVGPVVSGQLQAWHQEQLARSYWACLETAEEHGGITSVAFCGISTGVFGFPRAAAASIALGTVARWLKQRGNRVRRIVFNVYTQCDEETYMSALGKWR